MKILFLVYHGFSDASGITKKIHYQVKGLRENGHEVHLCYYDFDQRGHRCRFIDNQVLQDYGSGKLAAIRQRFDYDCIYDYCQLNGIQFVYARCNQNANPILVRFFKRLSHIGIKAVMEIPTYPYDQEFARFSWDIKLKLKIDRLFRNQLSKQLAAIVTFSDEERIFGQRTIRISNGVDFDSIPLHQYQQPADGSIHLVGVAEVHIWHGYDRFLAVMKTMVFTWSYKNEIFISGIRLLQFFDFLKNHIIHSVLVFPENALCFNTYSHICLMILAGTPATSE